MNTLWSSPLGAIGLLSGGGALLLLLQRYLSPRLHRALPLLLVLLSMLSWLLLRLHPQGVGQWWLWRAPLGLTTALGIQWDGQTWLAGWLLLLMALVALFLYDGSSRRGFAAPAFWALLLLAAALLMAVAATWSLLLMAWALMLFFIGMVAGSPPEHAARAWSYLLLSGLFLMMTPLFNGVDAFAITLRGAPLTLQAQLLLLLAASIPLGVYPFHLWLLSRPARQRGLQLALQGLPALAALFLLSRFQLPLLGSFSWVTLGIAGLLGSALAAWAAPEVAHARVYVLINRITWVMLAWALARETGAYQVVMWLAAWGVMSMVWTLIPSRPRASWQVWLALFFLMGLPLTPAFPLTLATAGLATTVVGFPGWLLTMLAQSLFVAAVLRPDFSTDAPPMPRQSWLLALAVILGLWWGLFPAALARSAALPPAAGLSAWHLLASAHLAGWLTWLLPIVIGWLLAWQRQRLWAGLESWQRRVAAIASLDWLEELMTTFLRYLASSLGFAADMLDGAGQFGWVLLALLLLLLLRK